MRKLRLKIICAVITFVVGTGIASFTDFLHHSRVDRRADVRALENSKTSVASDNPADAKMEDEQLRSLSPFDIERFIYADPQADIQKVWQRLGIRGPRFGRDHYAQGDPFFIECNGCTAETFEYDLDDEPGEEVLLRVVSRFQEVCRYLIFKQVRADQGRDEWKLLGYIDHDFGRYRMPQHSLLISGGRTWLVIQVQEQSGSGIALYYDRVFRVEHDRVDEVVAYPAEGHYSQTTNVPELRFHARIIDYVMEAGSERLRIRFSAKYFADDVFAWTKSQTALYTKRPSTIRFRFNPRESDLSKHELEIIYGFLSGSDDYLKYNYEELIKLAKKSEKNRNWLIRFLGGCSATRQSQTALERISQ